MDTFPSSDSLTQLLLRYPPASVINRNTNVKRRLANIFREDDFSPYTKPKTDKSYKSQRTKDLLNEFLSDFKEENNSKSLTDLEKIEKIPNELEKINEKSMEIEEKSDSKIEIIEKKNEVLTENENFQEKEEEIKNENIMENLEKKEENLGKKEEKTPLKIEKISGNSEIVEETSNLEENREKTPLNKEKTTEKSENIDEKSNFEENREKKPENITEKNEIIKEKSNFGGKALEETPLKIEKIEEISEKNEESNFNENQEKTPSLIEKIEKISEKTEIIDENSKMEKISEKREIISEKSNFKENREKTPLKIEKIENSDKNEIIEENPDFLFKKQILRRNSSSKIGDIARKLSENIVINIYDSQETHHILHETPEIPNDSSEFTTNQSKLQDLFKKTEIFNFKSTSNHQETNEPAKSMEIPVGTSEFDTFLNKKIVSMPIKLKNHENTQGFPSSKNLTISQNLENSKKPEIHENSKKTENLENSKKVENTGKAEIFENWEISENSKKDEILENSKKVQIFEIPPIEIKEIGSPTHPNIKKKTKIEETFHINRWGELQSLLKTEYHLINLEDELQKRFLAEIREKIVSFYKGSLKIRDFSNKNMRIFIDDKRKILRDMSENIQELLFSLAKKPRKIAAVVYKQKTQITSKFDGLFETLNRNFFEELTTEEPYQLKSMRFIDEILKVFYREKTVFF